MSCGMNVFNINLKKKQFRFSISTLPYVLITFVLFQNLFITLGFPSGITYFCDLFNLILGIVFLFRLFKGKLNNSFGLIYFIIAIYVLYLIFGSVINGVTLQLIVWSFRNNLRMLIFLCACINVLSTSKLEKYKNYPYYLTIVNFIIFMFQFIFLGYRWDLLGGVFGNIVGCNAGQFLLCSILTIYYSNLYFTFKTSFTKLMVVLCTSLFIGILSEVTILILIVPANVVFAAIINKASKRSFSIICSLVIVLLIGMNIFRTLYPTHYAIITSFDGMIQNATTVIDGYNIPRLSAITYIQNTFFKDSLITSLFGYGSGACEYSNFSFFTSQFYLRFGTLNYRWFDLQIRFLETGYLGLLLYGIVFFSITYSVFKFTKNSYFKRMYRSIVLNLDFLAFIACFYNATLRIENGYLLFFSFSVCLLLSYHEFKNNRRISHVQFIR